MPKDPQLRLISFKLMRENAKLPTLGHDDDAGHDAYISAFKVPVAMDKKDLFLTILECKSQSNITALGDEIVHIWNQHPGEYELHSLDRVACCLGFATEIPKGYYMSCVPRSGISTWAGLTIINTPTTIDAGYRNEWIAVIVNLSRIPRVLKEGDKICQCVLVKINRFRPIRVDELTASNRGLSGFGSTDKKV